MRQYIENSQPHIYLQVKDILSFSQLLYAKMFYKYVCREQSEGNVAKAKTLAILGVIYKMGMLMFLLWDDDNEKLRRKSIPSYVHHT